MIKVLNVVKAKSPPPETKDEKSLLMENYTRFILKEIEIRKREIKINKPKAVKV